MTDLWQFGAGEIVAALAAREVSATEIVQAHLDRIETVNGAVNALTRVLTDDALDRARSLDRALAAGDAVGPLAGVPVSIKDNIDVAGQASTSGIPLFADAIAERDEPVVERLRGAGAIVIGRANMADLGLRLHTESALHGHTRNPWDKAITPGGSSGGDAVAVATGMAAVGIGGDFAGSVRLPARNCGIVGLKPTLSRIPRAPGAGTSDEGIIGQLYSVRGPLARSVADLRRVFAALVGVDSRDPFSVPAGAVRAADGWAPRVAVAIDPGGLGVDEEVADGVARAAEALRDAGYRVEEADPPDLVEASELAMRLAMVELRPDLEEMAAAMCPDGGQFLRLRLARTEELDLAGFQQGLGRRLELAGQWSAFLAQRPLLLAPTSTEPPFTVGEDVRSPDDEARLARAHRMLVPANLLGLPAVAVPVGQGNRGPLGVQLIGPRYADELCLDAAAQIEARLGRLTPIDPQWAA